MNRPGSMRLGTENRRLLLAVATLLIALAIALTAGTGEAAAELTATSGMGDDSTCEYSSDRIEEKENDGRVSVRHQTRPGYTQTAEIQGSNAEGDFKNYFAEFQLDGTRTLIPDSAVDVCWVYTFTPRPGSPGLVSTVVVTGNEPIRPIAQLLRPGVWDGTFGVYVTQAEAFCGCLSLYSEEAVGVLTVKAQPTPFVCPPNDPDAPELIGDFGPPHATISIAGGSQHVADIPTNDDDRWQADIAVRTSQSTLRSTSDPTITSCFTFVAEHRGNRPDVQSIMQGQQNRHTLRLDAGVWDIYTSIDEYRTTTDPATHVGFDGSLVETVTIQAPVGLPVGSEPGVSQSPADEAVSWDPDTGRWTVRNGDGSVDTVRWGTRGDIAMSGDVDGDGVADRVVWRPSNGRWYALNNDGTTVLNQAWGTSGDIPMLGDVDGDGLDDMIVWRPSNGRWYAKSSATFKTLVNRAYGSSAHDDVPLVGDLDGDGKTEMIIWRPSTGASNNGRFYAMTAAGETIFNSSWGAGRLGDIPLIGDVDGNGADEVVIFRPSTGRWYPKSIDNTRPVSSIRLGAAGDRPMMFDVDGDGDDDAVVWRTYGDKAYWYARDSASEKLPFYGVQLGSAGETPTAGNYR